jgi:hypothetical protein
MKRIFFLLGVLLVLMFPSAVLAQGSSTCQQYDNDVCSNVSGASGSNGTGSSGNPSSGNGSQAGSPGTAASTPAGGSAGTAAGTGSSLPFTGLDLYLIVGVSAALIATGLVVRRASGIPVAETDQQL